MVVLSPGLWVTPVVPVGSEGVPLNVGEARGAKLVATKAVVAILVVLLPAVWVTAVVPVGKVGVPIKVGESRGAKLVATKAVVASFVELSKAACVTPIVPVGSVTVPVKVGDASGASAVRADIFAFRASASNTPLLETALLLASVGTASTVGDTPRESTWVFKSVTRRETFAMVSRK